MINRILKFFGFNKDPKCKGNHDWSVHTVDNWRETSGNGQYGTCTKCGDEVHQPEFR